MWFLHLIFLSLIRPHSHGHVFFCYEQNIPPRNNDASAAFCQSFQVSKNFRKDHPTTWTRKTKTNLQWMFPKMVGFPPKSSILIGFSIKKTIHFGVFSLFLETSTCSQRTFPKQSQTSSLQRKSSPSECHWPPLQLLASPVACHRIFLCSWDLFLVHLPTNLPYKSTVHVVFNIT